MLPAVVNVECGKTKMWFITAQHANTLFGNFQNVSIILACEENVFLGHAKFLPPFKEVSEEGCYLLLETRPNFTALSKLLPLFTFLTKPCFITIKKNRPSRIMIIIQIKTIFINKIIIIIFKSILNIYNSWIAYIDKKIGRRWRKGEWVIPVSYTHLDVYKRQS